MESTAQTQMRPAEEPEADRRRRPRRSFRQARRSKERVALLGGEVDLVRPEEVLHHVSQAVRDRTPFVVANHNMHSLFLLRAGGDFGRFYAEADLIEVDSAPLIHFARMLRLQSRTFHRCTYLDWRDHFWSLADRHGWRVFYLGGGQGVADAAARSLSARYPGAQIRTRDGYFDAEPGSTENARLLASIEAFEPQVLFVGMGMPRQETWIQRNKASLPPCVVFSVGAAFDYEAGVQRSAPRWLGPLGLEWAFRLISDPRRLFSRYCIEPWFLVGYALGDLKRAVARGFRPPAELPGKISAPTGRA